MQFDRWLEGRKRLCICGRACRGIAKTYAKTTKTTGSMKMEVDMKGGSGWISIENERPKKIKREKSQSDLAHDRLADRINGIILKWRKRRGLTRAQFADVLGRNVSTIRKWEYGYHIPRQSTVLQITAILDINDYDTHILLRFAKMVDDYRRRGEVFHGNMPEAVYIDFEPEDDFEG